MHAKALPTPPYFSKFSFRGIDFKICITSLVESMIDSPCPQQEDNIFIYQNIKQPTRANCTIRPCRFSTISFPFPVVLSSSLQTYTLVSVVSISNGKKALATHTAQSIFTVLCAFQCVFCPRLRTNICTSDSMVFTRFPIC